MTSTFKSHHRAKCWWNNRDDGKEHPFRTNVCMHHRSYKRKTLLEFLTFCCTRFHKLRFDDSLQFLKVELFEELVDSFSTDSGVKTRTVFETVVVILDFVENLSFEDFTDFFFDVSEKFFEFVAGCLIACRFHLLLEFRFKTLHYFFFFSFMYFRNDVAGKVDNLFEVIHRNTSKNRHSRWNTAKEPDVRYR